MLDLLFATGVLVVLNGLLSGSSSSGSLKSKIERHVRGYKEAMEAANSAMARAKGLSSSGSISPQTAEQLWKLYDSAATHAHQANVTLSAVYSELSSEITALQERIDQAREPEKSRLIGQIKPHRAAMAKLKASVKHSVQIRDAMQQRRRSMQSRLRRSR